MASGAEPKLSPFDAYLSAVVFLQLRNNRRPSVDLAATALAMVPRPDGGPPPDPTTWDDWVRAVQTVLASAGNIPISLELQPKEGQDSEPSGELSRGDS